MWWHDTPALPLPPWRAAAYGPSFIPARPAEIAAAAGKHVPCEKPLAMNGTERETMTRACRNTGAVLLHVSTDYVFDGGKGSPYVETDCPRPLNVYGISKLAGEHLLAATWEKHFIVRSSGLHGIHPCVMKGGMNFVDKMLKFAREKDELQVVDDEVLTPTYTRDLARQIAEILSCEEYGVLHATSEGSCSWYEFAKKIFELAGASITLKPRKSDVGTAQVRRPMYSVLENARLKQAGLNRMRPWEEALEAYLKEKGVMPS